MIRSFVRPLVVVLGLAHFSASAQGSLNWGATGASAPPSSLNVARPADPAAQPQPANAATPNGARSSSAFARPGQTAPAAVSSMQPVQSGPTRGSVMAKVGPRGIFDLPDSAPATAAGKPTTVGAIKRQLAAALAAKAGPHRTVQAKARAGVAAARVRSASVAPVRNQPVAGGFTVIGSSAGIQSNASNRWAVGSPGSALAPVGGVRSSVTAKNDQNLPKLLCTDKGPPSITEIDGTLSPGAAASIYGYCFGDRAGRVEVIGNFPGGKLDVAFTSWSMTGVAIQVTSAAKNATDGTVAVTIVGADGRRSPAMQANYVAARETVEVPAQAWSPAAEFSLMATTDNTYDGFKTAPPANPAASGTVARTVRINPQCTLATMSVDVAAGGVSAIQGFDQGPPNQASTMIAWTGTCLESDTVTQYIFSSSMRIDTACSVSFVPRAWASCPVGVSP